MARIRRCNSFCSLLKTKKPHSNVRLFCFTQYEFGNLQGFQKAKPLADKIYNLAALSLDTVNVLSNSYAFKNIAFAFVLSPSLT